MTRYNKLLLGFLLVFLTFRFQNIDLLPAFIGFLIVYSALGDLADSEPRFIEARKVTLPLIVISLFFFVQVELGFLTMVLSVLYNGLLVLMLWHICMAISNLAAAADNLELKQAAEKRWKYYLVVTIFSLATPIVLFLGPAFVLGLIIAGYVVSVLLLMLFYRAGQVLG